MSLGEFQRALADLISAPELVLAVRAGERSILARYELTERERRRLDAMLCDRRMSANCTLYRVMRLTPIYSVLPLTCRWLGERLGPELDAFWRATLDSTIQFGREAHAFADWLERGFAGGRIEEGPLHDALRFEIAAFEVKTAPRGPLRERELLLAHELETLLDPRPGAAAARAPRAVRVRLDASGEELEVSAEPSSSSTSARAASAPPP